MSDAAVKMICDKLELIAWLFVTVYLLRSYLWQKR